MSHKRLIVMAGGTGGHVFPGLAIAHYLMMQGWQVRWMGTEDRMEASLVPEHGIEIDFIKISGLRGKGILAQLAAPLRIWRAVCQAKAIMHHYQPDVVLGMGGYVSGPGGLAAWLCNVPVVLHEQNGIAGLTNRWLARIATKVLQAFPGTFPHAEVVGNPLRRDLLKLPSPAERFAGRTGPIRILIVGGSQGAGILNQVMPMVADKLGERVTLWHQVGKGAMAHVLQAYQQTGRAHKVTEFIDDMAAAYAWADVVVCRSGAMTVSEVAAAGLAAIFVPFQHKDRQQYWNALPFLQAGAARIIEQPQFTADSVSALIADWSRQQLLLMAERARAQAVLDATERIAMAVRAAARKE